MAEGGFLQTSVSFLAQYVLTRKVVAFSNTVYDVILSYPWYFLAVLILFIAFFVYKSFNKIQSTNATRSVAAKLSHRVLLVPSAESEAPSQTGSYNDDHLNVSADAEKRAELRISLLRSLRIFGDVFEDNDIFAMAKHLEIVQLVEGEILCKSGDPDNFIYLLQEGKLLVSCVDPVSVDLLWWYILVWHWERRQASDRWRLWVGTGSYSSLL